MSVEVATYVSELSELDPPGTDFLAEGDNHLRLIKSVLKNSFPTIDGALTPSLAQLNAQLLAFKPYTLTPQFVTTTQFRFVGTDVTSVFFVGRRVKLADSTTLYARITASVFSGGDTTVTVAVDGGTNLTVALNAVDLSAADSLGRAVSALLVDYNGDALSTFLGTLFSSSGGTLTGAINFDGFDSVASAASVDLVDLGNLFNLTGTTTTAAWANGPNWFIVRHADVLTLTHSANFFLCNNGQDITTAAGDYSVWVKRGSAYEMVHYQRANGFPLQVHPQGFEAALLIEDQKAAGTDGGNAVSGDWRTRDLNTVLYNNISGASLATNQITLPAGTYYIEWSAPHLSGGSSRHQTRLRNITGASTIAPGTSEVVSNTIASRSFGSTRVVLGVTTLIELQHRVSTTRNTDGFGMAANFGEVEVYSRVFVQKIA